MSLSKTHFDTLLAYEASAGSGKTFSLVVRYLSLLILGSKESSILALTFTKKAAFEMSHRIVESLESLHKKEAELSYLSSTLGLTKEEILKRVDQINANLDISRLNISTIDSFFATILRLFSFYALIAPNFAIASKKELSEIESIFLQRLKQKGLYDSFLDFALRFDKSQKQIFEIFDNLYQSQEFSLPIKDITNATQEEIIDIAFQIKELFAKNGLNENGLKYLDFDNFEELKRKTYLEKESLNYWIYKKAYEPKADDLLFLLKEKLICYQNSHESYLLSNLKMMLDIYTQCRFEQISKNSTLTFGEVTLKAKELLSSVDSDFLYYRLDARIDHILIDEFQDTNVLQFQILKPLIDEISSGIGIKEFKSFFFVGDKKQSIYRFRGGKKELFDLVAKRYEVKVKKLGVNYRSCKNIVEFANNKFANIIQGYSNQKAHTTKEGYVEVSITEDLYENVYNSLEKLLLSGVKAQEIAILTFINEDAKNIIEYIKSKNRDIKIYNEAKVMLKDMLSIKVIIEFLKYLLFQEKIYKVGFLSLIDRDIDTDVEISHFNLFKPLSSLVKDIINEYNLFDGDINLLKFLSSLGRYKDIEEFIYLLDEYEEEAISQKFDGLRVLTVHKSKGLEFESVILCDKIKGKNSATTLFLYENEMEENIINLRISKRDMYDKEYKKLVENEKKLSSEDELNALYVAITRAKNNLIITAKEQKSGFAPLNLTPLVLGDITPSEREEKKTISTDIQNYEEFSYGLQNYTKKEKIKITNQEAVDFGVALHYMLEMAGDFSKESQKIAYKVLCTRFASHISHESLEDIKTRVARLCEDKTFLKFLRGKVNKEVPIFIQEELRVFDLLIEFDDRFIIVDYKSSTNFHHNHILQLLNYKKGLQAITDKNIECYICYLLEDNCDIKKVDIM